MTQPDTLIYPAKLKSIYTQECIEYRKNFNDRMHAYLEKRIEHSNKSEKVFLSELSKENNLIVPFDSVTDRIQHAFDVISVAANKDGKSFIFLEHKEPNENYMEGVGKSAITLKILGVKIPYSQVPDTEEAIQSGVIKITSPDSKIKLISSDMFFIGIEDDGLSLGPVKGEQLLAQWDLARHIFRTKDPDYVPGKHREPKTRNYLEAIGSTYHLDHSIFADTRKTYAVDNIFLIERREGQEENFILQEYPLQKRQGTLRDILERNPCYHKSTFWKIDVLEHKKRLDAIMKNLKKMPDIYKITPDRFLSRRHHHLPA